MSRIKLTWFSFFFVKVFVGIPIDQYHFGCGLSFSHPRCSRQDLCLFKGTHFGHILNTTYRKHFQNLLRNQWWIIMNYLYMGVSMGLYSIHTIPRKWSIRLSLLLGPSSTMIPALNLPQVFITEEDRPKLKCHWLGDRIIDHCLQINLKADQKFWWGPKHPKPIAGRSEIWHTQHPRNTSWLCHGVSAIDCNWECTERPNATGPFWMIPHCFRWVLWGSPFGDSCFCSSLGFEFIPMLSIPHLSDCHHCCPCVLPLCFVSSFRHAPIWGCDPSDAWRYTKTDHLWPNMRSSK